MKVQYVFGPNAGQQFHAPRDQFIDILIKSGVLELIEDTPVRRGHMDNAASQAIVTQPVPVWGIFKAPLSGQPAIQCDYMRSVQYYTGKPENAHTFVVGKASPPAEVIQAYAAACEGRSTLEKFQDDGLANLLTRGPKMEPWDKTE
jgi:hypothetical protein